MFYELTGTYLDGLRKTTTDINQGVWQRSEIRNRYHMNKSRQRYRSTDIYRTNGSSYPIKVMEIKNTVVPRGKGI